MENRRRHTISYERTGAPPLVRTVAQAARHVAIAAIILFAVIFWGCFFVFGPTAEIDTHFTQHPETIPAFRITPWRPSQATGQPRGTEVRTTREAFLPLVFFRLRYTQVSNDAGLTCETVSYAADVRWIPVSLMLIATLAVVVIIAKLIFGFGAKMSPAGNGSKLPSSYETKR